MTRLSVLVSDDDPMIREALRDVLDAEPDFDVIATASDTDEAIELAARFTPSVVVLDVRMPGGGGTRATREIRVRSPRTRILAFSAYSDLGMVREMEKLGAAEYLVKGVTNAEIVAAVRRLGSASPG
ncbi:response regulator transcription factor [Amycolatopsis sp. NPDC059657]|uniref:response regulator n=1 Tax=Amycolatopsis sp. NPDC059657 TaxID=3346899 RepID=UPI0036712D51